MTKLLLWVSAATAFPSFVCERTGANRYEPANTRPIPRAAARSISLVFGVDERMVQSKDRICMDRSRRVPTEHRQRQTMVRHIARRHGHARPGTCDHAIVRRGRQCIETAAAMLMIASSLVDDCKLLGDRRRARRGSNGDRHDHAHVQPVSQVRARPSGYNRRLDERLFQFRTKCERTQRDPGRKEQGHC